MTTESAPQLNPRDISPRDWQEVFALLDTALELDPASHARWLEELGARDPDQARLSPLLKDLLRAHADVSTADFLQSPPTFAFAGTSAPFDLAAQALVGPYRLLREIGQGGMASVWLAERADGLLERHVALKLPHQSWGVASFADRMGRERNILASLTHPNIARLYDAGLADDGRPFLALEFVDGEAIDKYATARTLGVRARVELVVQVARAVAHAHARLVVHRDLKPSNILVDVAGQTHLLDFGIAQLIDPLSCDQPAGSGTEGQLSTQTLGRALTPDYASPEQIRGDAIGTASDIYSLGIVLFELLAGERPYRMQSGLGAAALIEAMDRVAVPRASAVARDAAVGRQLAGDLDAILARTLEKASGERYATMDALADDLERHLHGEPVLARPDSRAYRTERWVRRHKLETAVALAILVAVPAGAAAQAAVLVAIAAGAGVALWQARKARAQAVQAQRQTLRAQAVQGFLLDIFRANSDQQPDPVRARNSTARELLDLGAKRVEAGLQGDPEARVEVMQTLGEMYYQLQLDEEAAALEERRIALLKQLYGARDPRVAEALILFAASLHATRRRDDILPVLGEARSILDAAGDHTSKLRGELLTRLAQRHQNISFAAMREHADAAVRVLRALPDPDAGGLSTALHLAARARVQLGAFAEGEQLYREAISVLHQCTPVPQVVVVQGWVALGECLAAQHQVDNALQAYRDAAQAGHRYLGEADPGSIVAESRLAGLLHASGQRGEGRRLHGEALRRVLEVKGPEDTLFTPMVRMEFGRSLFAEGRLQEALELVGLTNESNRRHYQGSAVLGHGLRTEACILTALGRYGLARELFALAREHWLQGAGAGTHASRYNRFLLDEAGLDLAMHEPQRAIDRLAAIAPPLDTGSAVPHPDEVERDLLLSQARSQLGDTAIALRLAMSASERLAAFAVPAQFPTLEADAARQLGLALLGAGGAATARPHLERALSLRRAQDDASSPWIAEAEVQLATCWLALGEPAQAAACLDRAAQVQGRQPELGDHFVRPLLQARALLAARA